jgi:hypothetical protein
MQFDMRSTRQFQQYGRDVFSFGRPISALPRQCEQEIIRIVALAGEMLRRVL